MKIGILTLPLHTNYGGLLQAYALMSVLRKNGHEVVLINRHYNYSKFGFVLSILKRSFIKIYKPDTMINYRKEFYEVISKKIRPFIDNIIVPKTKTYYTTKAMQKDLKNYQFDAIIVGSDQVWRPQCAGTLLTDYFLSFANDDIVKLSYAASFGTDAFEFSKKEQELAKRQLKYFKGISVRERSGIELCKKYLDVEAVQHLDPTMLLSRGDYIELIQKVETEKIEGSLFSYVLDKSEEKNNMIELIAKKNGYIPFKYNLNTHAENALVKEKIATLSVESWIRCFYDKDYIVTDSFHGCVFSILFNKPFIAIGNRNRGLSRFNSLLEMFELEDRMIFSIEELTDEKISSKIDWKKVNKTLEEQRKIVHLYFKNLN